MATAMMLFGISLLYADLGSLSYNALVSNMMSASGLSPILTAGVLLMSLGLFFKLGLVPMYFWVPETYQGTSNSSLALLSYVPKIGVLGNFLLLFTYTPDAQILGFTLQNVLLLVGILSVTIGNVLALGQDNVKRMLGFSSIAHSGFLLLAFAVMGQNGLGAMLFYLVVYLLMNFAVFAIAEYFTQLSGSARISDWKGLGNGNLYWAASATIVLSALIGLPPTAGFNAKLNVLYSLFGLFQENGSKIVLIVAVLAVFNIVISVFYYLKMPFHLFFKKREQEILDKTSLLSKLQLLLMVLPLIILFALAGKVMEMLIHINDIVKYLAQ
jgi:NADH-quinone oxidoreductase subunit N